MKNYSAVYSWLHLKDIGFFSQDHNSNCRVKRIVVFYFKQHPCCRKHIKSGNKTNKKTR